MTKSERIPSMIYGTAWKKERSKALVEMALQAGFTAFDVANQHKHYREDLVGEGLRGHSREKLFLQTKFTPLDGQDSVVPYEPTAAPADQVRQSFLSSLAHLHTDYLDSYLLHGPYYHPGLGPEDWEVWAALEKIYKEGGARQIGISNVNAAQLKLLVHEAAVKPMVVQNRCFANRGWDKEIRTICQEHQIVYQGFSLLTANPQVLTTPEVSYIAQRLAVTPAQVVFRFAREIGILPLTGTTDPNHMKEDLAADTLTLTAEEIRFIENCSI